MQHKIIQLKPQVTGIALALALLIPATAHGASSGDLGTVRHVSSQSSSGASTATPVRSMRLVGVEDANASATEQRPSTAPGQRGLGRREAAIGLGILVGILLLGLWGDVVVGTVVVAVADLICATATLATRRPRRTPHNQQRAGSAAGDRGDNPTAAPSTTH